MAKESKGFTLIEILVAIGIVGLLVGIAVFALQGGQRAGRDTKRKSDLEQIRAALEFYRSSCLTYPATLSFGGSLVGDNTPASCTGNFMQKIPQDSSSTARQYRYAYHSTSNSYSLCAALEDAPVPAMTVTSCGGNCGGVACNYIVTSP